MKNRQPVHSTTRRFVNNSVTVLKSALKASLAGSFFLIVLLVVITSILDYQRDPELFLPASLTLDDLPFLFMWFVAASLSGFIYSIPFVAVSSAVIGYAWMASGKTVGLTQGSIVLFCGVIGALTGYTMIFLLFSILGIQAEPGFTMLHDYRYLVVVIACVCGGWVGYRLKDRWLP